jgi:Zn-dependent membrane protease YugP
MITYLLIFAVCMVLSWLISYRFKSRFGKYSLIPMNYGITGQNIAEKMLKDNGINDVRIQLVEGELTDHYNPLTKTISLSRKVYFGNHIAAVAVSAHECGHALQHATAYSWLSLRSAFVPVVRFASNWIQWILLAGILFINAFPQLMLIGIVLFAFTTIFSIISLPVEINSSNRALLWLNASGITTPETHLNAKDALRWAAYTYVIAALGSLATLLYYLMIYLGRR